MMRRKIQTIGWFTALLALTLLWASPAMAKNYKLYIAGTQVTDANCNNLKDITGVTVAEGGVFKYDPKIRTLVMKSVTVSNEEGAIRIGQDLKIWVSGTNRVESKNGLAIDVFAHTVIDGDGSLTATSINNTAICFNDKNLTISNITFEATGRDCGITSMYIGESGMVLTIKNANVIAKGAKGISNISDLITEGCKIVEPAGGKFDGVVQHAVVDAEGNVAKEVEIIPTYPLYIAGTQVTELNYNDLSKIPGVTVAEGGEFKYDPVTTTLTMKGITVSVEGKYKQAILNENIHGLKIEVEGTNTLKASNSPALHCKASTEICGNGTCTMSATKYGGIFIVKTNLTITNCTIKASGKWGIIGDGAKLTLTNAKVTATGTNAAIDAFTSFTTEGCEIVEPAGGKFDETKRAVVDAEGNVAKLVKVETIPVTGVTVTPKTVDLTVGKTQQLTISVEPATASNQRYTCQSDNESVATVTNTGLITAVSVGTANITVTTEDGNKTETCTVTVSQSTSPDNPNAVEDALFADISVAPNPFSSQLRISHKEAINIRYALLDAKGTTLYQGVLEGAETTLNTENLKAGIYLLRLSADNGATKTITVVKNR